MHTLVLNSLSSSSEESSFSSLDSNCADFIGSEESDQGFFREHQPVTVHSKVVEVDFFAALERSILLDMKQTTTPPTIVTPSKGSNNENRIVNNPYADVIQRRVERKRKEEDDKVRRAYELKNPYAKSIEANIMNRRRFEEERRDRFEAEKERFNSSRVVSGDCTAGDSCNVTLNASFSVGDNSNVNFSTNTTYHVGNQDGSNHVEPTFEVDKGKHCLFNC